MTVRVIGVNNRDDHRTELKDFTKSDIKHGLAHNWASDWARAQGFSHVIVCVPMGSHKILAPMVTIALR